MHSKSLTLFKVVGDRGRQARIMLNMTLSHVALRQFDVADELFAQFEKLKPGEGEVSRGRALLAAAKSEARSSKATPAVGRLLARDRSGNLGGSNPSPHTPGRMFGGAGTPAGVFRSISTSSHGSAGAGAGGGGGGGGEFGSSSHWRSALGGSPPPGSITMLEYGFEHLRWVDVVQHVQEGMSNIDGVLSYIRGRAAAEEKYAKSLRDICDASSSGSSVFGSVFSSSSSSSKTDVSPNSNTLFAALEASKRGTAKVCVSPTPFNPPYVCALIPPRPWFGVVLYSPIPSIPPPTGCHTAHPVCQLPHTPL